MRKPGILPFLLLLAALAASCSSSPKGASPALPWEDSSSGKAADSLATPPALAAPASEAALTQGPGTAGTQEPGVQKARETIQARQEKRKVLAKDFVQQADDAFQRGEFQAAAGLYADAYQLDPENRAARDGVRRTEAVLGGKPAELGSAEGVASQQQIRWARERMRVEGLMAEGDRAMGAGDFDTAIQNYRIAETTLRYNPNLAGGSLDASVVEGKLQAALNARQDAEAARRAQEAAAAGQEKAAAEAARRQYFDNILRSLYSEANSLFTQGRYQKAGSVLDRLLEIDPRNAEAKELREVANEAWHAQRERQTSTEFREQWKRTFEELRHLAVPPKSAIENDLEYWRNVVSKRVPLDTEAEEHAKDPTEAAIQQALDSTRIEPRFDDQVEAISENLAAYTKVNFVVSRAVREDVDEDTKTIHMAYNRPMPVSQILSIIEDLTGNQVKFVIRNGVVNVLTPEEAQGNQVLIQYEVRDIVRKVQDFQGTEVNLTPSGGIEAQEEPPSEKEATIMTEDELLAAIQENIEPDSWGDQSTATIENGTLIVYHRPDVQDRVRQLLNDLRKASNIMVEIRVRFLKVEDSFLQDIGVDFRGLGNDATAGVAGKGSDFVFDDFGSDPGSPASPGTIGTGNSSGVFFREASDDVNILGRSENLYDTSLGDENVLVGSGGLSMQYTFLGDTQLELILRAVEKSKRSEIVTEPKLMVYNTSRANLTVANQVSYVGDFDVEIAQAAAIADPIVRVAQDGVFLDVRPTVSADRRYITLDVRPTVATLRRPIPTFQTSLGFGSPVTLQLPELEVQKVRTTVMIPDGGTLLLGGMKIVDQQNLESGVPFLNRIPFLSFLFSRQGQFESYRKLLILLSARVIIPTEFEPKPLPAGTR